MIKKTDEISPVSLAILSAVIDNKFSNVKDSKFQKMLDERIAEQHRADAVAEAEANRINTVSSFLKPSAVPTSKCKVCGKLLFGYKDLCFRCEEEGNGVP